MTSLSAAWLTRSVSIEAHSLFYEEAANLGFYVLIRPVSKMAHLLARSAKRHGRIVELGASLKSKRNMSFRALNITKQRLACEANLLPFYRFISIWCHLQDQTDGEVR